MLHRQSLKYTLYNDNRYGVHVKETTTPPGWKCQPTRPSIGLQWTMRKPSYHWAGCSCPQNIIICRYSGRVAPIYSNNKKLKMNTKQDMQRPEIPYSGQAQKTRGMGFKYFGVITTLPLYTCIQSLTHGFMALKEGWIDKT